MARKAKAAPKPERKFLEVKILCTLSLALDEPEELQTIQEVLDRCREYGDGRVVDAAVVSK